jgi:hypothetical protein
LLFILINIFILLFYIYKIIFSKFILFFDLFIFLKDHNSQSYNFVSDNLKLLTLFERWSYFCIRFPVRKNRGFSTVSTSFSRNNWPPVRRALAAKGSCNNVICLTIFSLTLAFWLVWLIGCYSALLHSV